ncbi:class I SAM-dependent methyltransferase [Allonocardiopsis opalescens]|uniref:Methyltransferase family protein n=1 Tax=Allonocardiopsis opalescens TaxID=1144618 RepID=A0A2T0Q7U8_9ACTN|nr:class I SAM-dependent methyltransferase [Allonocardiopsis opalescens]PRX99813.1 methyltransferase family protein [Allonocardiopsis opalescens]
MTDSSFLSITRSGYDAVADAYVERSRGELAAKPLDRALLAAFAETARADGLGPVADIGCGWGRITAYLHGLGLEVFGIDLSPGMLALARQEFPELRFEEGSMTGLDLPDGSLGGVLAYYSFIHIPPVRQPEVFAEFHRLLAPGGHLMLAFQVGDEQCHLTEAFGRAVELDYHRLSPDNVAELLHQAGFAVHTRVQREPERAEATPHAYLLARRPPEGDPL